MGLVLATALQEKHAASDKIKRAERWAAKKTGKRAKIVTGIHFLVSPQV
jgi:hypothetical protein